MKPVVRLDKFLKLTQLVKRRTIAQEMISVGAVRLNGRKVKAAAEVKSGDRLEVAYPRRLIVAEVLIDDEAALKRRPQEPYRTLEERPLEPQQDPWEPSGEKGSDFCSDL